MSVSQNKANLRAQYLQQLANQDFFSLIEKSSQLTEQFQRFVRHNQSVFQHRFVVSFYPFESEVQLNIESESREEPFQVAYVRIVDWKEGVMNAHPARRDTPEQWEEYLLKNGTRIFHPAATQRICAPEEICVILVPGLAFTPVGGRLGRGAGFYDRFLARYPQALRIGVGFHDQVSETLPADPWDQSLDVIMTNQKIYEMKTYAEWQKLGKIGSRST